MAITGIVMMAYADGFHGDSFVGVALAVGSASTSALYKVRTAEGHIAGWPCWRARTDFKETLPLVVSQVLFKMFLGSANLGEVAHFLSTMGFFNLIFISCVPLILYFTKVEHWGSLSSLPWGYMCGLAGLWLGKTARRGAKIQKMSFKLLFILQRPSLISLSVFNILVHVGVVLTYPILISIGTLLSVPGNAG